MEIITWQILGFTGVIGVLTHWTRNTFRHRYGGREWALGLASIGVGTILASVGWFLYFGYKQLFVNPSLWPSGINMLFLFAAIFFLSFWISDKIVWPTGNLPLDQLVISIAWLAIASGATVGFVYALPTVTEKLLLEWATSVFICSAAVRLLYWLYP